MKNKNLILGLIGVVILIGVVVWFSSTRSDSGGDSANGDIIDTASMETPEADPLDIAMDFYNAWLHAIQDETADPTMADILNSTVLSGAVQKYIKEASSDLDPVLCQATTPKKIGGKLVSILGGEAQILILARGGDQKSSNQAIATLQAVNGEWQISNISCISGESAPVREFSFDREGFLLKNVPAPLDSKYWHLVFEEYGQQGHTAPLFFSTESTCMAIDGTEATCDESAFTPALKAHVQGQMTEEGVNVQHIQLLKQE